MLAGVGNVLRADALHAARIHPAREASSLSRSEFDELWDELRRIMRAAAELGRIATVDAADGADRRVYKQEHCRTCGAPVQVWQLSGRTAYACPLDQQAP